MYSQPALTTGDRTKSIAGVIVVHAAIVAVVLNSGVRTSVPAPDEQLQLFDVREIPPPPPIVEEVKEQPREKREEGKASARNIKSKATPVVAPKPRVVVARPPPIVASPTPAQGSAPTQGASPVPGPGTGAGGTGTGTGSGGAGSGAGGGGQAAGAKLISRTLSGRRDYPGELIRRWPPGARVYVAVRVQTSGRATNCRIDRSSGVGAIDAETCRLVEKKLRFRPARNDRGEPVASWYGYVQYAVNF